MLSQSRRITLRNGLELWTPLLVPSLSSGAVGPLPIEQPPGSKPGLVPCSLVHSELYIGGIDESLLLSAYDIDHGLLVDPETLRSGFAQSRYSQPRVLMVDSGWYEKDGSPPGGPFAQELEAPRSWEQDDYERTIDSLDSEMNAVVVSWDHAGPYSEQIQRAQEFFGARARFASTLLLKPPGDSRFHHFERLSGEDLANLVAFDIVGVTENELGNSTLDRLETIARLRRHLDEAHVTSPIHVFGGLDPLYTPLYFAAGAEIFDGLGWLRYAYREGLAVHREAAVLLDRQISKRGQQALHMVSLQNLDEMGRLTDDLRRFAHRDGDWAVLHRGSVLSPIFESLEERLGGPHGR